MYDIDVVGYDNGVNKLRLFDIVSVDDSLVKEGINFDKKDIEKKFCRMVYDGQWFGGLREPINAFIDKTQEYVTGTVRVKLFKGSVTVVGRKSPTSLYDVGLATYSKDTVDTFDHKAAMGFIYVWGLPDQTAARAHQGKKQ
jgi:argininosuccinate synthase